MLIHSVLPVVCVVSVVPVVPVAPLAPLAPVVPKPKPPNPKPETVVLVRRGPGTDLASSCPTDTVWV